MGCDVHAYVEHAGQDSDYWQCFAANFGSRDYGWFGILAGVRVPRDPVIPLRGVPEGRLSWEVQDAYTNIVNEEYAGAERYISAEQASTWLSNGYSTLIEERDGAPYRISGPDWHSASWLTADELAQCIGVAILELDYPINTEWHAALAAMRMFEQMGERTRLVFWFDN